MLRYEIQVLLPKITFSFCFNTNKTLNSLFKNAVLIFRLNNAIKNVIMDHDTPLNAHAQNTTLLVIDILKISHMRSGREDGPIRAIVGSVRPWPKTN